MCPSRWMKHKNGFDRCPSLMQESFWWWRCGVKHNYSLPPLRLLGFRSLPVGLKPTFPDNSALNRCKERTTLIQVYPSCKVTATVRQRLDRYNGPTEMDLSVSGSDPFIQTEPCTVYIYWLDFYCIRFLSFAMINNMTKLPQVTVSGHGFVGIRLVRLR